MIHMYALSYLLTDYIKQSLTSILDNASEPICLTIVDNRSEESDKIFSWIQPLIDSKKVHRYVQLKTNVQIMAFNQVIQLFPPDDSESFFMMTELDLLVKNIDWIKETKDTMSKGNVLSGYRLSLENYGPPHGGHIDDGISCGFWLMAMDTKVFNQTVPMHIALSDSRVRASMSTKGKMVQIQKPLYHLGWDSHIHYPAYFQKKVDIANNIEKWNLLNKSEIQYVYES